jgi:hypothetical protein
MGYDMRRSIVLAVLMLLQGLSIAAAQSRTPWGDPDFQGVWSNQTPIPVERPSALGDKRVFTKDEAAKVEETALSGLLARVASDVPVSGELNEIWLEAQKGKVPPNLNTSLVVDPPDGKIPYTAEGKQRWDRTPKLGPPLPANRPEDRAQSERCITTDGLLIPNPFYNNYHQIVQAPGYIVIVTEMMHEARIIPIDRRPHVGPGVRSWLGDSRGWWEGQTLVVETTNFNERRLFRGATEQLRLVERFTRLDADTIDYQLTITDPATFSRPWTVQNALRRGDGGLYEVACHEGNLGMRGILSGARAEEAREQASSPAR